MPRAFRLQSWIPVLALVAAAPVRAAAPAPLPETPVSAIAAHTLRRLGATPGDPGSALELSSLRGHVVVLNFWASWCGPCRKELPQLRTLAESLAGSGGRVVPVSIDTDPRNASDFAQHFAPGLVVFHDGPDGLARSLDLPALPYTLVLDRDGRMLWSGGGGDGATLAKLASVAQHAAETRGIADGATEESPR